MTGPRDERLREALAAIPVPAESAGFQKRLSMAIVGSNNATVASIRSEDRVALRADSGPIDRPLRQRLGNRWLAAAAVFAATIAAASGLAIAGAFDGSQDPVDQIDPREARLILAYRTSWGQTVAVWAAPASDQRVCTFFQLGDSGVSDHFEPRTPRGAGAFCPSDADTSVGAGDRPRFAMMMSSAPRGDGSYSILVRAAVVPGSTLDRLAVEGPAGVVESVASADGYLVAELPGTTPERDEFPSGGPYYLVGYDASGKEVLRESLDRH
jgi:hypothetical protein